MKLIIWGRTKEALVLERIAMNGAFGGKYDYIGLFDKKNNYSDVQQRIDVSKISEWSDIKIVFSRSIAYSVQEDIRNNEIVAITECIDDFLNQNILRHDKATNSGYEFCRWIQSAEKYVKGGIGNFFEIGANYGQDANFVSMYLGIPRELIFCFEANPKIAAEIEKEYRGMHVLSVAVSNKCQTAEFYIVDETNPNSGISTLCEYEFTSKWEKMCVECITMKDFLVMNPKIETLDFVKIDVEGMSYEVLLGFEERLSKVKCIQLEAEFDNMSGHYSFREIVAYMYKNNFELVDYQAYDSQNDSLWVNREFMNVKQRR